MPFVWDSGHREEPPVKRRKISARMARYSRPQAADDNDEQFPFDHSEHGEEHSTTREDGEDGRATVRTSDREELIQCIKRGQRTKWVPRSGLEALCAEVDAERNVPSPMTQSNADDSSHFRIENREPSTMSGPSSATDALRRSLSALRTNDLVNDIDRGALWKQIHHPEHNGSPPSWQDESRHAPSHHHQQSSPTDVLRRSRAPSLGSTLSSSYVMRIPTSPLVHATNNPTLDFSPRTPPPVEGDTPARRRTMPSHAFESFRMSPLDPTIPNFSRPLSYGLSRPVDGSAYPQEHRPRRSLSSFTYQTPTLPQGFPWNRQRRPSGSADMTTRHRASMVGSFEESLLRGSMSTPPSKPLDFVAQIGVMGKGNCPASLKCPAHVSVPFPAVFYNYPSASSFRSISDDNPSPYVGNVDLEHNLKPPDRPRRRSRRSEAALNPEELAAEITKPENTAIGRALAKEGGGKQEKTSASSNVSLGGAYRVPQKGQLQVIIKNPNKTAVKLFLVPYDLEGMVPGTKTFIRQRSYSSGPIIEAATPEKQADFVARDPLSTKDILRYLIHLKFCCTTKNHFYLYDNIRVVFANRAPDDKEKLRTELQLPEPRFSPHKPTVGSHSRSPSLADAKLSSPAQGPMTPDFEKLDDMLEPGEKQGSLAEARESSSTPFRLAPNHQKFPHGLTEVAFNRREENVEVSEAEKAVSLTSGFLPSTSSRSSPVPWPASNGSAIARKFSPTPVEAGHGLLSRKLRELNGSLDKSPE